MKALRYTLIFLIIIQLVLPYCVPLHYVYHNRIDYNYTFDNIQNDIDPALEKIKIEINRQHLKDYIIILGDSVMYGSPGNSDQAVNAFMEKQAKAQSILPQTKIFNLAYPAMQNGDIYTMLLKLDQMGISTDHLIFNVRYASFVPRVPDPPVVFWLKDDLKKLDAETFQKVLPQLNKNGYKLPDTLYGKFKYVLYHDVLTKIKLYSYKDYLHHALSLIELKLTHHAIPDDTIVNGDPRPWYQKDDLVKYVQSDVVAKSFTDKPLDLTAANLDIFFMDKIVAHQKGKKTLVVLSGTNHTLMKDFVNKPGYQANVAALDQYFQQKQVGYVNLEGKISDSLFSDHTHLVAEGYKELAAILWKSYTN
ncbi:MAG: hypothetical protein JWM44_1911 [Bacilli bacterium]|nr:hypothetical protein [Bacilli bacterium]